MRSYTLVELITVLVILGIVAAVGVSLILQTADAWSFSSQLQNNAIMQSMLVIGRMSREMRQLKDDASITTATSSTYAFTDINSNAITFNRSGNTLMRNSDSLADYVTALSFTYYKDDGTAAAPLVSPNNTDIRRIEADFSILAGSNTLNFRFQARPQNLRRFNEKFK